MANHERTGGIKPIPEIKPNGVYTRPWIIKHFEVSTAAIIAAEDAGHLRRAPMGKSYRYLGRWLIRWLRIRSKLPRRQGEADCQSESAAA